MKHSLVITLTLLMVSTARGSEGMGVSSWASWNLKQVSRTECRELRSVPLILHWNKLPPKLRERIIFVQSAEGSTGDGQPYKGNPLEEQYFISQEVWNVMGWSNRNVPQALYWSGLFATHCRLDIWNIPHQALKDEANFPAFVFFNRYAGHTDPATAPSAFCALRDGLDASDFRRFPASEFGGKKGNKRDVERYIRIAAAYARQGARMDDPQKATSGGMVNRKRSGSNDHQHPSPPAHHENTVPLPHLPHVRPAGRGYGRTCSIGITLSAVTKEGRK